MEYINKFMLPRLTEDMYEKEAISSIHLTKEIANKINELIEAYNFISKERLTNLQTVNGRIDKLVLFIQDNLYNTLVEMFKAMQHSGEWKALIDTLLPKVLSEELTYYPTTAEAVNGVSYVKDIRYPYGHAKRYGAVGDGVTDDTNALNKAATICRNNGYALICSDGKYKINADVDFTFIPNIVFKGDIICENGVFVHAGNSSYNGTGSDIEFGNVTNLKISGLKNSHVSFNKCEYLYCYANGDTDQYSIGYCTFTGGYCQKVELFGDGNKIGWVNENTFDINHIKEITIGGNYDHNNNHFPHCNMERGTLNLNNARNNRFSCRGEGGLTVNDSGNKEANIIENEYYYKYKFGESPEETDNHTIRHYGITALQSEQVVMSVSSRNRCFPIGAMHIDKNGKIVPQEYHNLFDSGVVELEQNIAIRFDSDAKCLRAAFTFYDSGMNVIEDDEVFTNFAVKFDSSKGEYYVTTNQSSNILNFYKNSKVKFIRYRLYFGNDVSSLRPNFITLKVIKLTNTQFEMYNQIECNVYHAAPTTGYWRRGDRVYNNEPDIGGYIGFVCVESGTPGIWNGFGRID